MASPRQLECPHAQSTSVLPAMPSQWALQYFDPSVGIQEQAGFSHFLGCAILSPPHPLETLKPSVGHGGYDACAAAKDGNGEGSRGRGGDELPR